MSSTFPVLLPEDQALFLSSADFEKYIHATLSRLVQREEDIATNEDALAKMKVKSDTGDDLTTVSESIVTPEPSEADMDVDELEAGEYAPADISAENKMYTENQGIAHRSTESPLLDLFSEIEKTVSGPRLRELLDAAWKQDSLATFKIVWNARSIHLGKGEKECFYRALGWMKARHLETILVNLPWMIRAVIEKRTKPEEEDAPVIVEKEGDETSEDYDVLCGISHGYWKDLLNILVLDINGQLNVLADPRSTLNQRNVQEKPEEEDGVESTQEGRRGKFPRRTTRKTTRQSAETKKDPKANEKTRHQRLKEAAEYNEQQKKAAKDKKHKQEADRHANALAKMKDPFYWALHITVARLFAEQLRKDTDLLKTGKRKEINKISLAAKWAPSLEGFHDKHTFIASSIAEILYPKSVIGQANDSRDLYLRRAREEYRRLTLSPLRKALEVVERNISAQTFDQIDYAKVPSIAMDKNKNLFASKDFDRFESYIGNVAEGKTRISGAVLMPASLVSQSRTAIYSYDERTGKLSAKKMMAAKSAEIQSKVIDGQWKTLVQRIKDNGKLQSSISVCDVSGSMLSPRFPDKTVPMDSSIGLSLLLAEITAPPFGGNIITFSANPTIHNVGGPNDTRTFTEKVKSITECDWGMNTDFTAVFERLILPMAKMNNVRQEDMVKQVFVFSDMQFDSAQTQDGYGYGSYGMQDKPNKVETFETAYERLKKSYAKAGYEMPKLVFWNLAGGRAGYNVYGGGDPVAPKPVTKDVEGTVLVGGYSQGMMKMFLDEGSFGDEEEEEELDEVMEEEGEDGEGIVGLKKKKKGLGDPMQAVWKAIGHKSYDMLRVVD